MFCCAPGNFLSPSSFIASSSLLSGRKPLAPCPCRCCETLSTDGGERVSDTCFLSLSYALNQHDVNRVAVLRRFKKEIKAEVGEKAEQKLSEDPLEPDSWLKTRSAQVQTP